MRKFFGPIGSISRFSVESQALRSNMLGDPSERVIDVYLPAGHNVQGLPLLVDLVGFTSSGLSHTNWVGFRENLPERLDRLIGEQRMPPVVVAFPDCFTRLGGNQRAGDGGQLRSRSRAVHWDPAAGHVRHLRGYRGTLGELVTSGPCRCDRNQGGQSPQAEGALHRLRREGSVQSALRGSQVRAAAERAWHCAPLR